MSRPTKPRYIVVGNRTSQKLSLCIEKPVNPDGTCPPERISKPVLTVTAFGTKQLDPFWVAEALNGYDDVKTQLHKLIRALEITGKAAGYQQRRKYNKSIANAKGGSDE